MNIQQTISNQVTPFRHLPVKSMISANNNQSVVNGSTIMPIRSPVLIQNSRSTSNNTGTNQSQILKANIPPLNLSLISSSDNKKQSSVSSSSVLVQKAVVPIHQSSVQKVIVPIHGSTINHPIIPVQKVIVPIQGSTINHPIIPVQKVIVPIHGSTINHPVIPVQKGIVPIQGSTINHPVIPVQKVVVPIQGSTINHPVIPVQKVVVPIHGSTINHPVIPVQKVVVPIHGSTINHPVIPVQKVIVPIHGSTINHPVIPVQKVIVPIHGSTINTNIIKPNIIKPKTPFIVKPYVKNEVGSPSVIQKLITVDQLLADNKPTIIPAAIVPPVLGITGVIPKLSQLKPLHQPVKTSPLPIRPTNVVGKDALVKPFSAEQQAITLIDTVDIDRISSLRSNSTKNTGGKKPYTVEEHRELCRTFGLPSDGPKEVLSDRLLKHLEKLGKTKR
jgi:hypothetical protein